MNNKDSQANFNLKIVKEGLSSLAAKKEEQINLNKVGLENLDNIFDIMIIDYISYLEEKNIISPETCSRIRNLYTEVELLTGDLADEEIENYIREDNTYLNSWRLRARDILMEMSSV